MGDKFRKVQPQEPLRIQADSFNAMLDAARTHQASQHWLAAEQQREQHRGGIVRVRNDTGGDRERFHVVALDRPIFGPDVNANEFKSRPSFVGIQPLWPLHAGRFAILLEPLAQGKIGRGLIEGVSPVRLDIIDEDHRFAEIATAGEMGHLESAIAGSAQILWKEPGKGLRWAVVRVGNEPGIELLRFELVEDLTLSGEAEARLLKFFPGDGWKLDDRPVTIFDWYIDPGMWQGYAGYRGFCVKRLDGDDRYDIVWMETPARSVNFTLTQPLFPGYADATVDAYYLQGKDPLEGKEPGTTLRVHDPQRLFRRALKDARGMARWNDRERRYEVIQCDQQAILCRALLREKMCPDHDYGLITQARAMTPPPFGQDPDPPPLVALNRFRLAGIIGRWLLIGWDELISEWVILQVQHYAQPIVTDIRLRHEEGGSSDSSGGGEGEGETCVLEVKRRTIAAMTCGDETDWTVVPCQPQPSSS